MIPSFTLAVVRRLPGQLLTLVLVLVAVANLGAQQAHPIVTSDELFYVPFTVPDGAEDGSPKIVELYVSGDRGKTWTRYQERKPNEGRFSFRAGVDGEFWFAIRTVDANGAPNKEEFDGPEMVVIVDREKPQLNFTAQVGAGRQVRAEWTAADSSLVAAELKLEYRVGNDETWQPVDVQTNSILTPDGTMQGQASWWAPAGTTAIDLRAVAKDRAGNVTSIERRLPIGLANTQPPQIPFGASQSRSPFAEMPLPANLGSVPGSPGTTGQPQMMATQGPVAQAPRPVMPGEVVNPYVDRSDSNLSTRPIVEYAQPNTPTQPLIPRSPFPTSPALPTLPTGPPAELRGGEAWQSNPHAPPMTNSGLSLGAMPASDPPQDSESPFAASPGLADELADTTSPEQPPAENGPEWQAAIQPGPNGLLVSKSRRFHLDYDVETAGTDGVYRVEVWFTDDGGRTWRHYGDDEDRISPCLVDVASDGLYGFRLIIQGKEGFAARPPKSGDPADIWIAVDATAPNVKITTARYGRGTQAGMLHILWEARDQDLVDRPITLLYSPQQDGPWRKISGELPNTGRYDWRVDDRVPDRIYLRLEAVDRAGNTGFDALLDPINGAGLAPQGHIRTVRPVLHQQRFGTKFFGR